MKHAFVLIAASVLFIGTVAMGFVQGSLNQRWGPSNATKLAKQELNRPLPERVGSWRLQQSEPLSPDVIALLQCDGYISRIYENDQTGDVVTVVVLLGPAGPIAVHTP